MHLEFSGVAPKHPQPGVTTRRLDYDHMTVVRYEFAPGAAFPMHHHAEEQLVVMLSGSCRFRLGAGERELQAGDAVVAAPHVPHGATAGPDGCRFLNILSPRRTGDGQIQFVP